MLGESMYMKYLAGSRSLKRKSSSVGLLFTLEKSR